MKRTHFEALRPICPACRIQRNEECALAVTIVAAGTGDDVLEGVLECRTCRREYPIIDGIPLLVPDPRAYIANQLPRVVTLAELNRANKTDLNHEATKARSDDRTPEPAS